MSVFSDSNFIKKLIDLNNSQQSIQTLSLWLIHHRKHAKAIVDIWLKELKKVKPSKKLTFLYLANDVVQNSKRKGPEFGQNFKTVILDAYKHTCRNVDEKMKGSMGRMVDIWRERQVFSEELTDKLRSTLSSADTSSFDGGKHEKPERQETTERSLETSPARDNGTKVKAVKTSEPSTKKKKKEMTLREEIESEMLEETEPPEAEDLMKALQDLENAASSDAAVRERIAKLPQTVSDITKVERIQDKREAEDLVSQVNEACQLLTEYNARLQAELEERRQVAKMLHCFLTAQRDALAEEEVRLQEYSRKLSNVSSVRRELRSHVQSLPDLTLLPVVTGGLKPLPSAGDLFATDKD